MKKCILLLLLSVILLLSSRASPKTPALQLIAEKFSKDVGSQIQAMTHEVPVAVLSLQGDQALLGHEGRLLQELKQLLVFQLEAGNAIDKVEILNSGKVADALEDARRQGASILFRCVLGIKGKNLILTTDLYSLRKNFWERMLAPAPEGSSRHFFNAVRADKEIFLLMDSPKAPPYLGSWRLSQLLYLPKRILDLGMGDLDGDGTQEIILLLDDTIEVYTIEHGGFAPKHLVEYSLNKIPESKIVSRDPVGTLVVSDFNHDGKAEIFFNYFNRRYGQVLSWTGAKLVAVRKLDKNPLCLLRLASRPIVVYGEKVAGTNYFSPKVQVADINSSKGKTHELGAPFVTLRCWQGAQGSAEIIVVDTSGNLEEYSTNWVSKNSRNDCGAGVSLADLDGDGLAELIVSDHVWPGEPDSLKVISKGELAFSSKDLIGGVVAIAAADNSTDGVLLATVNTADHTSRVYLLGP